MESKREALLEELTRQAENRNRIPMELYQKYSVKRGLRNEDGSGVLVGLTEIGDVHGYIIDEGDIIPDEGRLLYRGINITELVTGLQKENRPGYRGGQLPAAVRRPAHRPAAGAVHLPGGRKPGAAQ